MKNLSYKHIPKYQVILRDLIELEASMTEEQLDSMEQYEIDRRQRIAEESEF